MLGMEPGQVFNPGDSDTADDQTDPKPADQPAQEPPRSDNQIKKSSGAVFNRLAQDAPTQGQTPYNGDDATGSNKPILLKTSNDLQRPPPPPPLSLGAEEVSVEPALPKATAPAENVPGKTDQATPRSASEQSEGPAPAPDDTIETQTAPNPALDIAASAQPPDASAAVDLTPPTSFAAQPPRSPQDPDPEPVEDARQSDLSKLESAVPTSASEQSGKSDEDGPDTSVSPPPSAPPASPPATPSQDPGANLFEWEASEYVSHHRPLSWYVGLAIFASGLLAFSIFVLKEWLSTILVAVMMIAVVVYARRKPRILNYQLAEGGIAIGEKFYPYTEFRGFALVPHKAFMTIELDPTRRFMPRISMFFDKADEDKIAGVLEQHLPRNDRLPDPVDRLAHLLKF